MQVLKGIEIPDHMKGKMFDKLRECPKINKHIYGPEAYCEWHDWAEKYGKNHTQLCCDCGFFVLWVKK